MPLHLSKCHELIVATSNPHKIRELTSLLQPLGLPIHPLPKDGNLQPVKEDGDTLRENARKKASGYARQLQRWVIADDTGLEVDALDGAPGVRSARYAGDDASMAMNLALLIEHMLDVPDDKRSARFLCHLCVAAPDGSVALEGAGECRGRIGRQPIGEFGFGYDSVFLLEGRDQTLAELDEAQTAEVGHRGHAARSLIAAWQAS
ncbi:Non-canonical purine NTP pyrophosphatase [Bremerella volcania]|uniref:dITP/XTP pyrophosphatase n=1 Tax=Bremerella volcania TaxID=2527984 RepID=A0A518CEH5_9BACT|nr:RdgB/HAM1 family non-canonical purine NTP pyrophosphatase [Bremerella volcania]QDU77632.1 Non-canonical purine NTP pyrophosphatase [Bremerella volcania]